MSASARLAAASAVAASLFVLAFPAFSADLYEPPRTGSAYDDPRYAEIYGDDGPSDDRYAESPDDFEPPYPPRAVYNDEDRYDLRYGEHRDGAVLRHVVRDRLRAEGCANSRFRAQRPRVARAGAAAFGAAVRSDDRPVQRRGRRRARH
jgi:hypothetical protein